MWRRALWIGAGLGGLFLVAAASVGEAFVGNRAPQAGAVNDAVQVVLDGYVSVGLISTSAGAILIDCGVSADAGALRAALGGQPVAAIFLTHGHGDHVAGCDQFPGVPIHALRAEVDHIEGRARPRGPLPRLMPLQERPFRVSVPLEDGQVVPVGERAVTAFHLPGHTAGSAAYLVAGVLFLGDSARSSPEGAIRNAPWVFSDDLDQNAASLSRLAERLVPLSEEVQHIVFSHTGPIQGSQALLDWRQP